VKGLQAAPDGETSGPVSPRPEGCARGGPVSTQKWERDADRPLGGGGNEVLNAHERVR